MILILGKTHSSVTKHFPSDYIYFLLFSYSLSLLVKFLTSSTLSQTSSSSIFQALLLHDIGRPKHQVNPCLSLVFSLVFFLSFFLPVAHHMNWKHIQILNKLCKGPVSSLNFSVYVELTKQFTCHRFKCLSVYSLNLHCKLF